MDESKDGCKVGAAVFENHFTTGLKLPDYAPNILNAEANVIVLALSYISQHNE
jgi:hypothetical protein